MNRRERLLATFQGKPVDRPAVCFYEIGGFSMKADGDEFNVWNDPSWRPLVEIAHEKTDMIRFVSPVWKGEGVNCLDELTEKKTWCEGKSIFTRIAIKAPGRLLTSLTRRDNDLQTIWILEHLLKNTDDIEAYLRLPEPPAGEIDITGMYEEEKCLGDSGIVSVEMADPLCETAGLMPMGEYTVIAMTKQVLFHRLLERFARIVLPRCEQVAEKFLGRLWRIAGSEYASEPYLPPRLYREYVVRYTGEIVKIIQKYGGYARIHSHGRLRNILPLIAEMEPDGLDPLEPPPQGDMSLAEIKDVIGKNTVLMGNIEASDIENLNPQEFEKKVITALKEGTQGKGRGFILHPSACPFGRTITCRTMGNYETMVRLAEEFH
ncbi:MAG TPA: uroporphyrinogen decarboxylase family protein [bacterium]|nr:uroporphyrinogen decarboxylase family protein [bacterium]